MDNGQWTMDNYGVPLRGTIRIRRAQRDTEMVNCSLCLVHCTLSLFAYLSNERKVC